MRIEVFNGWVQLRDPDLVPERLRRPVFEKSVQGANMFDGENINPEALAFFSEFNDVLAVAMISEWSFGDTITLDSLQDLPAKTYDDIRLAVAPFVTKLIPDFGVDVDPKAITGNLNESAGS
jgi:hypothetical protein